ncbi:MAG: tRNA pseudouridine(38-40) synthase TruA [Pseudomonadota bacterium]
MTEEPLALTRYKFILEYDGGPFAGWQRQADALSVQEALERAAEAIDGAPVVMWGAGRTDAGVHALGQVAHADFTKALPPGKMRDAMNAHLRPHPIAVLSAEVVNADFNARFDARERRYLYRMIDRRPHLTVSRGRIWRIPQKLDAELMHSAAQAMVGLHDFSTFRDAQCQAKSPVKTLDEISVARLGDEVHVRCVAQSFLHRQVRSIVGSLAEVGRGKQDVSYIAKILAEARREACGPVAPPDGLYLTDVVY